MGQITRVTPNMIQVANNVTSTTVGNTTTIASITFDSSGVIVSASNVTPSIATSQLTGTITNAQLAGSISSDKLAAGVLPTTVANATTATTFTANQTFTVANVTNQLISSGPAYQNIVVLTDGTTITPNLAQTNNFFVTLGGNRTMANATNIIPGQSGIVFVQQDNTGSRTLAFGTGWRFPGNTAPTLTTTAGAVDMIVYTAWSSSNVAAQAVLNVT